MDNHSKNFSINNIKSISSLQTTLELLNKTTEDFLFVCDFCEEKIWYYGDFDLHFKVKKEEDGGIILENLLNIVHPHDRDSLNSDLEDIKKGNKDFHDMEYRWMNKDNYPVWINCKGSVVRTEDCHYMIGRVSRQTLSNMFNPLTGLFNQFRLMVDLKEMYKGDLSGYLMMLDIDDLSAINLNHGRSYGDLLLKTIGSTLEEIPGISAVYHNERNYFTVIIDTKDKQDISDIYQSVRCAVKDKCTVSAGAVPLSKEFFSDENALYDAAKLIISKAKLDGRNNLRFFEENEFHKAISSASLLDELQASVSEDCVGFTLLYQPQFLSNVYSLYGAEALLRYTSKSGKKIFPDEFIPLLESSKLIIPVGLWVLKTALNQCKEWRKSIPTMHISVNFSMVQLRDESIVTDICNILDETGMNGDCLTMEITESIPIHEMDMVVSIMTKLKTRGIQFAIDDFGTGYSNLGYLNRLNIDEIKIDRMFIKDIDKNMSNCGVLSQTMELAKKNAMRVCCEGVETTKELSIIEMYTPNLLQGYLFDKPLSDEEFTKKYFDETSEEYADKEAFVNALSYAKNNLNTIHFNHKDILRETNMGLWVMYVKPDQNNTELFFDETMESIMGLTEILTPEEHYEFWHSRIREDYVKYVDENFNLMTTLDKVVQLEYPWNHPTLGEVIVRSNGKVTNKSDKTSVIEGYHRILSNIEEV